MRGRGKPNMSCGGIGFTGGEGARVPSTKAAIPSAPVMSVAPPVSVSSAWWVWVVEDESVVVLKAIGLCV